MNMIILKNLLGIALLSVIISGCNGGSTDNDNATPNVDVAKVTITSHDLIAKGKVSNGTFEVPNKLEIKSNNNLTISKDATVIIK